MKFRTRKLANGKWANESKKLFSWHGIYIVRGVNRDLHPLLYTTTAPIGDTGYASFCTFDTFATAHEEMNNVKAIFGLED